MKVKVEFGEDHLEAGFEAESVEPSGISAAEMDEIVKRKRKRRRDDEKEGKFIIFLVLGLWHD